MEIKLEYIMENDSRLLDIAVWRNAVMPALRSETLTKIKMKNQNKWIRKAIQRGDMYFFILNMEGKTVGYCGLDKISEANKTAEMSLLVANAYKGMGYGTAAVKELLGIAFKGHHKLECVFIEVYDTTSAWQFWVQHGFMFEGLHRARKIWKGNSYCSKSGSILRQEYIDAYGPTPPGRCK